MPYVIVCKLCQKKLRIPETLAGKTIKCPSCGNSLRFNPKDKETASQSEAHDDPDDSGPVPRDTPAMAASPAPKTGKTKVDRPAKQVTSLGPKSASHPAPVEQKATPVPKTFAAPAKPLPEPVAPVNPPTPVHKPAAFTPPRPAPKKVVDDEDAPKNNPILMACGGIALIAFVWFFLLGGSEGGNVSGKVTLDNDPLTRAKVIFVGEDEKNQSPIVAPTDDKGNYTLVGPKTGGVPLGKYKVMVTKETLKDGSIPEGQALEQARRKGLLRNYTLPRVYESDATTPFKGIEVVAGNNRIDLPLKKKP